MRPGPAGRVCDNATGMTHARSTVSDKFPGFAALAQLVEQFIRNEKVASSNPASGTTEVRRAAHEAALLASDTSTAVLSARAAAGAV